MLFQFVNQQFQTPPLLEDNASRNKQSLGPFANSMKYQVLPDSAKSSVSPRLRPSTGIRADRDFKMEFDRHPSSVLSDDKENSMDIITLNGEFSLDEAVSILLSCDPSSIEEYSSHLKKIALLMYEDLISGEKLAQVQEKYCKLLDMLPKYIPKEDPLNSKLHIIVSNCFNVLVKILTTYRNVEIAAKSIRYLTYLMMNLNYWEVYNLLSWKPAIYQFINLIHYDLHESYANFINDYTKYHNKLSGEIEEQTLTTRRSSKSKKSYTAESGYSGSPLSDDGSVSTYDTEYGSSTPSSFLYVNPASEDHDRFVKDTAMENTPKNRKKIRVDSKLAAHRIIKKSAAIKASNKSSNYDPDVVHECQLPSPDEPDKLCLRQFSRKYELIRHQETVHSKKKKLFKCYVCVKQNPSIGPRIFTRHDTLAKHIRVNHKISGREAKAEVAFSKKHAEVVEDGDITVHVGRRKTKVDFELRAHMERRKSSKELSDDPESIADTIDTADTTGEVVDSPALPESENAFE